VEKRRRTERAFTLVEVLIASAIFVTIIGLVFATLFVTFNSWRRAEEVSIRQQQARFLFFRLNRELSSTVCPGKFRGDKNTFFFITALIPMAEVGYIYSPDKKNVSRFFEKSADFDFETYDSKKVVISNVEMWEVSYLDAEGRWQDKWEETEGLPRAIRIVFKIGRKGPVQENIVHIAVAE